MAPWGLAPVADGVGCEASAGLDGIPGAELFPGSPWCLLKGLPRPCAGGRHGLLTTFEVVQQRAVGAGELASVVLADLEQTGVAPAVQGPFADSEPIGGLTLNGPGHRLVGHAERRKEQAEDHRSTGDGVIAPEATRTCQDIPGQRRTARFERILSGSPEANP